MYVESKKISGDSNNNKLNMEVIHVVLGDVVHRIGSHDMWEVLSIRCYYMRSGDLSGGRVCGPRETCTNNRDDCGHRIRVINRNDRV